MRAQAHHTAILKGSKCQIVTTRLIRFNSFLLTSRSLSSRTLYLSFFLSLFTYIHTYTRLIKTAFSLSIYIYIRALLRASFFSLFRAGKSATRSTHPGTRDFFFFFYFIVCGGHARTRKIRLSFWTTVRGEELL